MDDNAAFVEESVNTSPDAESVETGETLLMMSPFGKKLTEAVYEFAERVTPLFVLFCARILRMEALLERTVKILLTSTGPVISRTVVGLTVLIPNFPLIEFP